MKDATSSTRSLVRATAAMGGSSVLTTLANIAKTKVVAVVLGPQGVGAFGILGALSSVMAVLAGLGLSSAAVRPITQALEADDGARLAMLRRGLTLSAVALGAVCAVVIWIVRAPLYDLAELTFGGYEGWAALALGVSVLAAAWLESRKAFIVAAKRPLDWARVTLIGGVVAAALSVAAVLLLEEAAAVICMVMALPVCSALAASWLSRGIARTSGSGALALRKLYRELAPVLGLGAALMVSSLMTVGTLFAAQWIIKDQMGIASVGHFQASWTISVTCVGFFFGALWMDYSPRLSAAAGDERALTALMNEQLYLSMLLAAPALLWIAALAPYAVRLLYAPDFAPAAAVLRWQALGDLVRVSEASLGFVLVILGRSRYLLLKELLGNALYLGLLWGGLARFGLPVAGMAFLAAQALRVALVGGLLRQDLSIVWERSNKILLAAAAACALLLVASHHASLPAAVPILALGALSLGCWLKLYRALRPEAETPLASAG